MKKTKPKTESFVLALPPLGEVVFNGVRYRPVDDIKAELADAYEEGYTDGYSQGAEDHW